MNDQEQLFSPDDGLKSWQRSGYQLYDGTPPHEAPSTSQAAAVSMKPAANRLQRQVEAVIGSTGPRGATDDELEVLTGLKHQTVSARRRELYLLGRIRSIGERPTRSGRKAKVWVLR